MYSIGQLVLTLALFASSAQLNYSMCPTDDVALQDFIARIEFLVLNTTDRALIVTRNVYLKHSQASSLLLQGNTDQMLRTYVQQVNETLGSHVNYTCKRQLLQQFRQNHQQIELLATQLNATAQHSDYQFQLISDEFYNGGANSTDFDNLYLEFMDEFRRASERLWEHMSEQTVEQQEELLEILDEIANEAQLAEKDKLYDEFIELYLFKNKCIDEIKVEK